jgi:hypothetical protein
VRVVNVVDLTRLQSEDQHPHGLPDREFDAIFTPDKPVIFAYHGYPWLIHRLTYKRRAPEPARARLPGARHHHDPFDMVMLNDLDRYRLAIDVLDHVPGLAARHAACGRSCRTPACTPAPTPASTAPTSPPSPTGNGPTPTPPTPPREGTEMSDTRTVTLQVSGMIRATSKNVTEAHLGRQPG